MTKLQKKKEEIINFLEDGYWIRDKWGNFRKTIKDKLYRMKVNKTKLRYEVKGSGGWIRIRSGYYRDLTISKDRELQGLRR